MSRNQKPCKMRQYCAGRLFERIAIHVARRFPVTDNGNRYTIVMRDYFTSVWKRMLFRIRRLPLRHCSQFKTPVVIMKSVQKFIRIKCYDFKSGVFTVSNYVAYSVFYLLYKLQFQIYYIFQTDLTRCHSYDYVRFYTRSGVTQIPVFPRRSQLRDYSRRFIPTAVDLSRNCGSV